MYMAGGKFQDVVFKELDEAVLLWDVENWKVVAQDVENLLARPFEFGDFDINTVEILNMLSQKAKRAVLKCQNSSDLNAAKCLPLVMGVASQTAFAIRIWNLKRMDTSVEIIMDKPWVSELLKHIKDNRVKMDQILDWTKQNNCSDEFNKLFNRLIESELLICDARSHCFLGKAGFRYLNKLEEIEELRRREE